MDTAARKVDTGSANFLPEIFIETKQLKIFMDLRTSRLSDMILHTWENLLDNEGVAGRWIERAAIPIRPLFQGNAVVFRLAG